MTNFAALFRSRLCLSQSASQHSAGGCIYKENPEVSLLNFRARGFV